MATNNILTNSKGVYRNPAGTRFKYCITVNKANKWVSGFKSEVAAANARARRVEEKEIEEQLFPKNKLGWFIKQEYIPLFLNEKDVAPSTLRNCTNRINKWILAYLGNKVMTAIDVHMISAWRNDVRRGGITECVLNRADDELDSILGKAQAFGYIPSNPAARLRKVKYRSKERAVVTIAEIGRLVTETGPLEYYLIMLAYLTGIRIGELLGLPWDCVHYNETYTEGFAVLQDQADKYHAGVLAGRMKTENAYRRVFLLPEAVRKLREWHDISFDYVSMKRAYPRYRDFEENRKWVWPALNRPGMYSVRAWDERWAKLKTKAGLKHIHFHDLRHSYREMCRAAGVPMETTQKQLGHGNASMTMAYTHISVAEQFENMRNASLPDTPEQRKLPGF